MLESLCNITYPNSIIFLENHRKKYESQMKLIYAGIKSGISDYSNDVPILSCYSQLYKSSFVTMNFNPSFDQVLNELYPSMNYVSEQVKPMIDRDSKEFIIGYILYSTSSGNINYINFKVFYYLFIIIIIVYVYCR